MSAPIIYRLRNREISNEQCMRKDFCMLRTLICKGDRKYRKVSSRKSNKSYFYESGRLFGNNYRECYYGYGIDGGNRLMYKISDQNNCSKLEDALIYRFYHEDFPRIGRACLMALKTRRIGESLVQYDLNTGKLIREIFLSNVIKFRYMDWAEINKMFYIKSIRSVKRARLVLADRISVNIAVVMAVFSTFPLKYVGMFEVDRRVFGAGVTNAMLTHSMLIVMYINGLVKFFNFDQILEKYKNFEYCLHTDTASGNIDWADIPPDLPMNIKITECPPVLFEVSCNEHDVKIGGYPWHYIYSPKDACNTFVIKSLKDHVQVEGGLLRCVDIHAEPDTCSFHNDESGRLIHVSGSNVKFMQGASLQSFINICLMISEEKLFKVIVDDGRGTSHNGHSVITIAHYEYMLRVYKLQSEGMGGSAELQTVASVNVHKSQQKEIVNMTSSGRTVKRRQSVNEITLHDEDVIHAVEYEDELDMVWLSVLTLEQTYKLIFYDNQSFQKLKEINLESRTEAHQIYEHNVHVDLDTIVEIYKPLPGQFICNVYRLSGDLNQDNACDILGDS